MKYMQGGHGRGASVLRGMNSTLVAYGQTASGKTYTMIGSSCAAHLTATHELAAALSHSQWKTSRGTRASSAAGGIIACV